MPRAPPMRSRRLRSVGQAGRLRHEQLGRHARRGRRPSRRRSAWTPSTDEVETSALTTAAAPRRSRRRHGLRRGGGRHPDRPDRGRDRRWTRTGETATASRRVDAWSSGSTAAPTTTSCVTAAVLVRRAAPPWSRRTPTVVPGAGTARGGRARAPCVAAVEATTGVRAEVVGKPNPPIFRAALDRAGGGRPLVVGDRLDTDIAGAAALGWDSLLVLTGISHPRGGGRQRRHLRPTSATIWARCSSPAAERPAPGAATPASAVCWVTTQRDTAKGPSHDDR